MINQADVRKYDEGKNAVNARQIYNRLTDLFASMTTCLSYVLFPPANITMAEFALAKLNQKGDKVQIDVEDSKTHQIWGCTNQCQEKRSDRLNTQF